MLMIYAYAYAMKLTQLMERVPIVRQQRPFTSPTLRNYKGGCPRTLQQRIPTRSGKTPRQPLAYENGL